MTTKSDIYMLANRLKVDQIERLAFAIGLQDQYDQKKADDHWKETFHYLYENKTDEKTVETLNVLQKEIEEKEADIIKKKGSGVNDLSNEIKELEETFGKFIEIIQKTIIETKL